MRRSTSAPASIATAGTWGAGWSPGDGFDFLFFYLYETDAAQHRGGDVMGAVAGADRGLELLVEAAGGRERFLNRYAVMVVADHSQSAVTEISDAAAALEGFRIYRGGRGRRPDQSDLALASSNRVSMVYVLPDSSTTVGEVAKLSLADPAADVVYACRRRLVDRAAALRPDAVSPGSWSRRRPRE